MKHVNNAKCILDNENSIASTATSIQLPEGYGDLFGDEFPYDLSYSYKNSEGIVTSREIFTVNGRNGDILNPVVRASQPCPVSDFAKIQTQQAQAFVKGGIIEARVTAGWMDSLASIEYVDQEIDTHIHDERYYTESEVDNKDFIKFTDTRYENKEPNQYTGHRVYREFKSASHIELPTDGWATLSTYVMWSDYNNSHRQYQIAWASNTQKFYKRHANNSTTWDIWKELPTSGFSDVFELGERARNARVGGSTHGRGVLLEKHATTGGEASGRIFFPEHNLTDAGADKYGFSIVHQGDPLAVFPSGMTPQKGNASFALHRHDNSLDGVAIMWGFRGSDIIYFNTFPRVSGSPTNNDDLVNKSYVDNAISGVSGGSTQQYATGGKWRYIRDWTNGSTANTGNHWVEIMAIRDSDGVNVALNKTVTPIGGPTTYISRVVDGGISSGSYYSAGVGVRGVQVDLGAIYDLAAIHIFMYYSDGRTYNNRKIEVSQDGTNWFNLYDATYEKSFPETASGKVFEFTKYVSVGDTKIHADTGVSTIYTTTFTLVKSLTVQVPGFYRVLSTIDTQGASYPGECYVSRNGTQVSATHYSNSTNNVEFYDDIYFEKGDVIGWWLRSVNGPNVYLREKSLLANVPGTIIYVT